MKRLAFIFALLACSQAWAQLAAPVGVCTPAATTSCTYASSFKTQKGDFVFAAPYNGSAATAPGTGSGFTVIKSVAASVNAIKAQWKFSPGGETTCGTFSSATVTFCAVYRGGWVTASTIGGIVATSTPSGTSGASGALSYPTITLQNPFSTSWVVCAGGSTSGSVDSAPAGMTLRSGTTITNYAFSDTNGNVSTWPTTSGPNPGVKWATACAEIVGTPSTVVSSQSAKVSDYYPGGSFEASTGTPTTWTFECSPIGSSGSLASNLIKVAFVFDYAVTEPTISNIYVNSDTGHATWTFTQAGTVLHDAGNNQDAYTYYIPNAAAGCKTVSVVFSNPFSSLIGHTVEYHGYKTLDQYVTSTGSAPIYTAGALTPTASGDLLDMFCTSDNLNASPNPSVIVASSGMLPYITEDGISTASNAPVAVSFVYNSTSAITTNVDAVGLTGNTTCMQAAFKNDGTGTAPSGVSIEGMGIYDFSSGSATVTLDVSMEAGDALLVEVNGVQTANTKQFSAVSALLGTLTVHQQSDANGGYPNFVLDCDHPGGLDRLTFTGAANNSGMWVYKIRGLDNSSHTACDDTVAGTPGITGNCVAGSCGPDPTITPSTANGMVFGVSETGTGPGSGLTSPTGAIYDVPTYDGQTDTSRMGTGNWFGHYFNSATSALTWTWSNPVSPTTGFTGSGIHLKAASAAPSSGTGNKRKKLNLYDISPQS